MRILHTSDWHLGRSLEHISRINEQRDFIDCLVNIADERDVDLVLIAGDIYDTYNPSAAAEELFYEAMDRLGKDGRAVVVIAGNHDNPERLCAASPLAYKNGIILLGYPGSDAGEYKSNTEGIIADAGEYKSNTEGIIVDAGEYTSNTEGIIADAGEYKSITEGTIADAGEYKTNTKSIIADAGPGWLELSLPRSCHNSVIMTMPYPSESRLEELLSDEADEAVLQKAYSDKIGSIFSELSEKFRDDTVNLIVAHLFLMGGSTSDSERTLQVGGAMTVNPSAIPQKTHYAALGHLHRPQQIRSAACPTYYAGSPLAYSFSEADYSKAVFIVDAIPGEKAEVTPVYLDCGKPLIKWYADQGIGQAVEWCEEGKDSNAWIDLEIMTDRVLTADEQKTIRSLHPGIINIRPRLKADEAEVLSDMSREGRKMDELFRDYYRYRIGTDIPDEMMQAFIEIINDDLQDSTEINDVTENEAEIKADGRADNASDNTADDGGDNASENVADSGADNASDNTADGRADNVAENAAEAVSDAVTDEATEASADHTGDVATEYAAEAITDAAADDEAEEEAEAG